MLVGTTTPFVLLDDASPDSARADQQFAKLYRNPVAVIRADAFETVNAALDEVAKATDKGKYVAGFLAYEAGLATEPALASLVGPARHDLSLPLLWFGVFDKVETVAAADMAAMLPDPRGAWVGPARPRIALNDYAKGFDRVIEAIRAGEIYQANLTFAADVAIAGHPLAAYAAIRDYAAAGHGGVVWTGDAWLLSFSPELFFSVKGDRVTARPMKGTAPRGDTPASDAALAHELANNPKQRAENLMILDLMRNDLARIAKPGSVTVPERFRIETYPSVHQMISSVTATLKPGIGAVDVLRATFPCGSVTGAPKIQAMRTIAAVERRTRGPYTGSIGAIAPDGDAKFNVAIRTLAIKGDSESAILGIGSGIVADSQMADEWAECLAKAAFLAPANRPFDLIETMAFDPRIGITLIERHLERMKASAQRFGFSFDRHGARNELQAATFRLRDPARVRLLLGRSGALAIEIAVFPASPTAPVAVAVAPLPVAASDYRLRHKTTDRRFYDTARRASGAFEILFTDQAGFLTEGSFTNIFVERGDDGLATPPLARGLLPGVLRAELIESGRAHEEDLRASDLAQGFYVGNAVRGLIRARLVVAAASPRG